MYAQRTLFFYGFLASAALLGVALYYFQGYLGLDPCPLCVFQRLFVIAVGGVFLVAAIHNPGVIGRRVYGGLVALVAGAGAAVSARHVWLQQLPAEEVPSCGPGLDYLFEVHPFFKALDMVLKGSGECAEVLWSLFGISIPGWTFIAFAGFVLFGLVLVFSGGGRGPTRNIFR